MSIAAGLAVLAAVASLTAAARILLTSNEAGRAESAVCAAPVEVADAAGETTLGCASQPALATCGELGPGDRVRLAGGGCQRERDGMSAGMRLLEGLPLDLNRAGPAELELLDGIGPTLAQRIVADRARNGPYASVEQLTRVRGIGPVTLERLRDSLRVR